MASLTKAQIRNLESGNISVCKLSKRLDLTLNQIYHIIYRDGIKVPKIWYRHFKMPESSVRRAHEMKSLRDQGFLIKEIAFKYGISQQRTSEIISGYSRILEYRKISHES